VDPQPPGVNAGEVLHALAAEGDDVPIYGGAGHSGGVLAG